LAKRRGEGPIPVSEIAAQQAIPPRFLELILGELKRGGYVESRRGAEGGYLLAAPPEQLTVGEIITFIDGPLDPVRCLGGQGNSCALEGDCAFIGLWERAKRALSGVYDNTTFQDLLSEEQASARDHVADFAI